MGLLRGGNMHRVCGSPMYPAGHAHLAVWKMTLHNAFGAQGSKIAQGLRHAELIQAAYSGHSSSVLQPIITSTGLGVTVDKSHSFLKAFQSNFRVTKAPKLIFNQVLHNNIIFKQNQFWHLFLTLYKHSLG